MSESRMNNKRLSSMFVVGRGLAQAIVTGVITPIEWDTQVYDELEEVAIVNPWTFVPVIAGYYYFYASARITNLNVGDEFELAFYVNGGIDINERYTRAHMLNQNVSLNIAGIRLLATTDSVDVRVRHNFGANRNLAGAWEETSWCGHRIR